MNRLKVLPLVACITVAVSISVAQNPAEPKFEVVSIRATPSRGGGDGGRTVVPQEPGCQTFILRYDPGRISLNRISVYGLIALAYAEWSNERGGCVGVSAANYLSGGPEWVRADSWDIEAIIPEGARDTIVLTAPTAPKGSGPRDLSISGSMGPEAQGMLRGMLRRLLADRFNLVLRPQTKEMPVYLLTVGKDGFKSNGNPDWRVINGKPLTINGAQVGTEKRTVTTLRTEGNGKQYESRGIWKMSMPEIAAALMVETKRPTLDRTNLAGTFDFHLDYDNDGSGVRPSIFKAIEKVGLKLESARAPVEVWVIERVDKPTKN